MEIEPQLVLFTIFAAVAGFMLFRIVKHGGFKAAMFGASIDSTVGSVRGNGSKMVKMPITVHKLGGNDPAKTVGLEVVAKSAGSYQMLPVALSLSEAKNLIKLLENAVGDA